MNKKLSLFLSLILSSFVYLAAQSIDYTVDGRHFYVASPNGRYFSGTVEEGPGCLFDAYTKQHFVTDIDSINISAVNNDGIACGSRMGKAGVWVRGKEWKMITALSTINGKPIESSEICGMSADATKYIALMRYDGGKATPVFCEVDKFENWDNDAAWEFSTLPTPTKDDLFYNMNPQFVQVCGMNYDATRILGRYVLSDGKRQVPFIWQKAPEGVWELNFVAERCLFNQEAIEGMTRLLEKESFDNALDYDVYRQGLESGIIYDLAPYTSFAWSGNGRYIPLSANIAVDGSAEGVYYAAVIDIDMDTLIIFTAVKDAGSLSVNDKGEVMIYTPQLSLYRTSYVASVSDPTKATPLIDYTKARNAEIGAQLEKYMTYQRNEDFDGNPIYEVASGSEIWANEGDAFVTFNYDEWNEQKVPHCYMVRFEAPVAVENIKVEQLVVYPNPSNGVIFFEKQLSNVSVFDIMGRNVYSQSIAEQSIDLSMLNIGTYYLTAICEGEQVITKIILTR